MAEQTFKKQEKIEDDIFTDIFGQENKEDLFCPQCLITPKYDIMIEENKIIKLSHKCKDKEQKVGFPFVKNANLSSFSKCYHCKNECSDICLECKNYICDKCKNEHIPKDKTATIIPRVIIGSERKRIKEQHIYHDKDIQFLCDKHFIKYKYFCPICYKNLCFHCKNYSNQEKNERS